jgi:hypothetical protein
LVSFDLKGKIIIWLIGILILIIIGLICYAIKDMRDDLKGVPLFFDKAEHEINWRKL